MSDNDHGLTPLTEMQRFVMTFMSTRKEQTTKLSGKRQIAVYVQTARFNRLREYIGTEFTGAALMSKSEIFDFMIYLLENYLQGTYKNYETFDVYYARMLAENKAAG